MRIDLATGRLRLRPFAPADARALARLAGDPDISRMTAMMPHPYPVEAAEGWIFLQSLKNRPGHVHSAAIALKDGSELGALVGGAGVFKRRPGDRDYELGYWIGKPYWGRGYASEAVAALIAWARDSLDCDRLIAGYFDDNPASGRVQEKLGFRATGETRSLYSLGRREKGRVIEMALELARADAPKAEPA